MPELRNADVEVNKTSQYMVQTKENYFNKRWKRL